MSIVIERVDMDRQARELRENALTLTAIVASKPGGMEKKSALIQASRVIGISLSRMPYILTFAKAERLIAVESGSSKLYSPQK